MVGDLADDHRVLAEMLGVLVTLTAQPWKALRQDTLSARSVDQKLWSKVHATG